MMSALYSSKRSASFVRKSDGHVYGVIFGDSNDQIQLAIRQFQEWRHHPELTFNKLDYNKILDKISEFERDLAAVVF